MLPTLRVTGEYPPLVPDARAIELEQRVLAALRERGPSSSIELGRALGMDRYPVRMALHRLERRGEVRTVGMTGPYRAWGVEGPVPIWEAMPAG
ncbi:MAG: hypothetical protein AVDCRST_MAG77-1421 [uncultured Chloroflexi bacterium]|uniref:HTH marR-type domain-containing protein n=1 Tax=uncultured Chloroflexota bacterium TaxID=166587 RepID=A0A6J4I337_9CHLR|nr:MAG: hypothetical protein AVDCRST_MAG77-1421 [uncultured Chloroflexota bacterium]